MEGISNVKQELDEAKSTLISLNQDIRRISGHNNVIRMDKQNIHESKRSEFNESKRIKRNDLKSVFNRLSSPIKQSDAQIRPRLNSSVIKEMPSRQEIVAAQCIDSESKARNKRIFGSLIGTLHKFCQEESRLKEKEDKKAQIEKKLEEQQMQERASLKREREALFIDRKRKQNEIKMLEAKMNRLKDFQVWKLTMQKRRENLITKTKPQLYFRPKHFDEKMEKFVQENRTAINIRIDEKEKNLKKELLALEIDLKNDISKDSLESSEKNIETSVYLNNALIDQISQPYKNADKGTPEEADSISKPQKHSALNSEILSVKFNVENESETCVTNISDSIKE